MRSNEEEGVTDSERSKRRYAKRTTPVWPATFTSVSGTWQLILLAKRAQLGGIWAQ